MAQVENVAAVIPAQGARLEIQKRPVPTPGEGEILVRNHAIAANPVDWKIQDYGLFVETYPSVLGSDVAGEVVSVGSGVTHFVKSDRVAGFSGVIYNDKIDHGAWQTYTILPELGSFKVPQSMSFEKASVFPMGMATAAVALFEVLGISREQQSPDAKEALIIWGASSSVGASAVQIARIQGWKVYATASPKHHSWLKDIGAIDVLDYKDPDVASKMGQVIKSAGFYAKKAFDPISEGSSLDIVPEALKAAGGEGGRIATVLWRPEGKELPQGVEISLTVAMRHAQDLKDLGRWFFNNWLEKHVASGEVTPVPKLEIVPGGVAVAQKVFDELKKGVSGKKLVVQV